MQEKIVSIPAISCAHCVLTIQREVKDVAGVVSVTANLQTKQTDIQWDTPATWDQIVGVLNEIGYPPQELVMP